MTWDEARRISLLKERPEDYPLKVTDVQEIGILDSSINVLTDSLVDINQHQVPGEEFAAKINGGPIWTFSVDYIERLRKALVNFRSDS